MISIEDQRELETLHSRFVHASDRGDFAMLRSLYTDDAVEDHGAYQGPVDGFVDWLRQAQDYFEIVTHIIGNFLFSIDGDHAESEGRGTAYLRLKGDQPFNMIVVNRHFDRYRRVEGRWLFSHRSVCVDWVQQFPPSEGGLDLVAALPVGMPGAGDPVYREVPGLIAALRATGARPA